MKAETVSFPCAGRLWINSYAGRAAYPVEVIGETPKRYRIRCPQRTRLAGRLRWAEAGQVVLVPKSAVTLVVEPDP